MNHTQKMFSIRDTKSEIYNPPFYSNTHSEAERSFKRLAMDEKSQVRQFPEDYDLYYIGDYNTSTGKIIPLDSPQHMCKAINLN